MCKEAFAFAQENEQLLIIIIYNNINTGLIPTNYVIKIVKFSRGMVIK